MLRISGSDSRSLTIFFYTRCPDLFIHCHPYLIQSSIEIGLVTGKLVTLEAKINLLFLVTRAYSTVFEQLTLFIATPLAIIRGEEVQHLLESGVFAKNRVIEKRLESFGIGVEVAQFFFKLQGVFPYVTVYVRETSFATQAAGGDRLFNALIDHDFSPSG